MVFVPKKPLIKNGAYSQDHVIAGVKMTIRGRFFDRGEYMQMVFQSLQKTRGEYQKYVI
jgi:hypothetical protein